MSRATFFGSQLGPKRLELLLELVPAAKSVRLLSNPDNSYNIRTERTNVDAAARRLGLRYDVVNARSESDLEEVLPLSSGRSRRLVVSNDALFNNRTEQLVALAARHAIPTIYFLREFAAAGGLISYGASITNTYRRRLICCPHSRRHQARRAAGPAADQVRAGHQPQDGPGARSRGTAHASGTRRRGDRVSNATASGPTARLARRVRRVRNIAR